MEESLFWVILWGIMVFPVSFLMFQINAIFGGIDFGISVLMVIFNLVAYVKKWK